MTKPKARPLTVIGADEIRAVLDDMRAERSGRFPRIDELAAATDRNYHLINRIYAGGSPFSKMVCRGESPRGSQVHARYMPPGWGYLYMPSVASKIKAGRLQSPLPREVAGDGEEI